jgi:hypothetical protein
MKEVTKPTNSFAWVPEDQRDHKKAFYIAVLYSMISMIGAYFLMSAMQ